MGICSSTLGKTELKKIPPQEFPEIVPVLGRVVHNVREDNATQTPSSLLISPVIHSPLTLLEESPAGLPNRVNSEIREGRLTPILEEALNELADPVVVIDDIGELIIYMNKAAKEK